MNEQINSQVQQAMDSWRKLVDEQVSRFTAMGEEVAKLEQKGLEQVRTAVDEAAKMTKESFAYAAQLSAEWRKLALEATKRASELISARS